MKSRILWKNKIKYIIINVLIVVVLVVIMVNQGMWLNNMHHLQQREFKMFVDQTIQETIWMELTERAEFGGGFSVYSHNLTNPNDTSRFFTKKVVAKDTIYTFKIDKNDQHAMFKIMQFALKDNLPINLDKLSIIFKTKLNEKYSVEEVCFDYYDLSSKLLIDTNKSTNIINARYLKTDTIPLDIIDSIGLIGYVRVARDTILSNMMHQLILSVLLIFIAVVCLFFISRSFIFQWKTEKMRQESINAMTHEFKRPISGAVAMMSAIPYYLEKNDIRKVLDYTQNIENELNKLTHYTQRIQQISNNEKQSVSLEKTKIEIVPFFVSLQQRYSTSEKNEREVVVNLHIDTSKKEMQVDLLHFSNVMDNLIENAIKYTVNSTVIIYIQITDTTDGLIIAVQDNGIGISSMDKKRIFDKFYRVKRDETKNKVGFGLGLTYVKSIIEAHGGNITVNSNLNEGSEFIITLKE